jgi:hypothetical protein
MTGLVFKRFISLLKESWVSRKLLLNSQTNSSKSLSRSLKISMPSRISFKPRLSGIDSFRSILKKIF